MPYNERWTPESGWQDIPSTNTLYTDDYWMSENDWVLIWDDAAEQIFSASDQACDNSWLGTLTVADGYQGHDGHPVGDNDVIQFIIQDGDDGLFGIQDETFDLTIALDINSFYAPYGRDPDEYFEEYWDDVVVSYHDKDEVERSGGTSINLWFDAFDDDDNSYELRGSALADEGNRRKVLADDPDRLDEIPRSEPPELSLSGLEYGWYQLEIVRGWAEIDYDLSLTFA